MMLATGHGHGNGTAMATRWPSAGTQGGTPPLALPASGGAHWRVVSAHVLSAGSGGGACVRPSRPGFWAPAGRSPLGSARVLRWAHVPQQKKARPQQRPPSQPQVGIMLVRNPLELPPSAGVRFDADLLQGRRQYRPSVADEFCLWSNLDRPTSRRPPDRHGYAFTGAYKRSPGEDPPGEDPPQEDPPVEDPPREDPSREDPPQDDLRREHPPWEDSSWEDPLVEDLCECAMPRRLPWPWPCLWSLPCPLQRLKSAARRSIPCALALQSDGGGHWRT